MLVVNKYFDCKINGIIVKPDKKHISIEQVLKNNKKIK